MKQQLLYTFILFVLLSACDSDEHLGVEVPQAKDVLELSVRAGDFVTAGASDTRAADNGATTTFENGDRVGVIIVENSNTLIADNLPYIYNGTSWSFDQQTANSENPDNSGNPNKTPAYYDDLYGKTNITYIVYYPYSKDANGVTAIAGNGGLKSKFPVKADQSTEDAYRASDLMYWQPSATSGTPLKVLSAMLQHAYASVSLSPKVKWTLANGAEFSYVSSLVSDISFTVGSNTCYPYQAEDGSFRYILPDGHSSGVRCFYTYKGKTYGNTVSISGAVVANTRYASTQTINAGTYGLAQAQVGDFYCKNNSGSAYLIPNEIVSLTDAQKSDCIGIVFWLGDATQKDKTLQTAHSGCTHGLVVALTDEETVWQNPYVSVQDWLNTNKSSQFLSVQSGTGSSDPLNNIQGYNNTKAIEAFNSEYSDGSYKVKAIEKVVAYRSTVSAPGSSSNWYLPSGKELTLLCGREVDNIWSNDSGGTANRDLVNGKLSLLGSSATQIQSSVYWSSTESSSYYAFHVHFSSGYVLGDIKDYPYRVRCVLAF